jgi:hypothetical protein
MNRSASRLDWREVAIVAIKAVHSVIFVLNATSVVHIFWVGVLNHRSRWTRLALIAALGESIVFVVNRGRCPLTQLVETMGADSGRVSDIFLPRWFADRIPQVFGPPLAIGLLMLAYHHGFGLRTRYGSWLCTCYGSGEPAAPRRQSLLRSFLATRSFPRRPPAYELAAV